MGECPQAAPAMSTPGEEPMPDVMEHVRVLADEIGPRPVGSEAERSASSYFETAVRLYGLQPENHPFETPRSPQWATVIYYALTVVAAAVAGLAPWALWPATLLATLAAVLVFADAGMGWGLSALMPRVQSQNVIARHVPRSRRGERLRRVVLVAHADTAKTSGAFSPSLSGAYSAVTIIALIFSILVPLILLGMAVLFSGDIERYAWYAAMAAGAYLIIPAAFIVQSELMGSWSDGANDNATGLATLLGVLAELAPEDVAAVQTAAFARVRRGPEAAVEEDVVPEGAVLTYAPAETPLEVSEDEEVDRGEPARAPQRGQRMLEFDTIDFGVVDEEPEPSRAEPTEAERSLPDPLDDAPPPILPVGARKKSGLLGKIVGPKEDTPDVRDWLGVDSEFDATEEGRKIGSWDNFEELDDDDWGLKGGSAGEEDLFAEEELATDDAGSRLVGELASESFARDEAARIRRRVTESVDRDFAEKEVWFVATGAGASAGGMGAFLDDYGDALRDTVIINVQGVGSHGLNWVTQEGAARRHRSDRRLALLARRVSREHEIVVKPGAFKGPISDAMPAIQRGFRAMSIMGLASSGLPEGYRSSTDDSGIVDSEQLERAVEFVSHLVREA
jgi:hypothetical protein